MAFNWQTFRTRTLTAAVFVIVMLAGLLWNHWSFLILFSVIHFGCWWEYLSLLEKIHNTGYHRYTRLGFMLAGFAIMLLFCGPAFEINDYRLKENFSFPLSVAGFVMLAAGIFQTKQIKLKAFGAAALGFIYISLSWGLMIHLRQEGMVFKRESLFFDFGRLYPCLIVFSIWINDTMAYIVGSKYGRSSLSSISPQKTWEGTIGGIILAILIIGFPGSYVLGTTISDAIYVATIASVVGTFGDLFESRLKRMAGVKDSGRIMPGHGGFLDRFDSMLFATPFVWLYVYWFV